MNTTFYLLIWILNGKFKLRWLRAKSGYAEVYLEPNHISTMEPFYEKS